MISSKRGKVMHNYIVWVYKRNCVDDLAVWLWDGGFPHGMLVEGCVCFPGSMMMVWKAAMGWWSWCTTSMAIFICFLKHHNINIHNDGSIASPPLHKGAEKKWGGLWNAGTKLQWGHCLSWDLILKCWGKWLVGWDGRTEPGCLTMVEGLSHPCE